MPVEVAKNPIGRPKAGASPWRRYIENLEDAEQTPPRRALWLLATEAERRNITIKDIARKCNREIRAFTRSLNAENPRIKTIELFGEALTGWASGLLKPLFNHPNEDSANHRIESAIEEQKQLFKNTEALKADLQNALSRADDSSRRTVFSNAILASAGMMGGDVLNVVAQGLEPYGFDIKAYYARDSISRIRRALAARTVFFDSLGLPARLRKEVDQVIEPFLPELYEFEEDEDEQQLIHLAAQVISHEVDKSIPSLQERIAVDNEAGYALAAHIFGKQSHPALQGKKSGSLSIQEAFERILRYQSRNRKRIARERKKTK